MTLLDKILIEQIKATGEVTVRAAMVLTDLNRQINGIRLELKAAVSDLDPGRTADAQKKLYHFTADLSNSITELSALIAGTDPDKPPHPPHPRH